MGRKRKNKIIRYPKINRRWKELFTQLETEYVRQFCKNKIDEINKFEEDFPLNLTEKDKQEMIELGIGYGEMLTQWNEYETRLNHIERNMMVTITDVIEVWCYITLIRRPLEEYEIELRDKLYKIMMGVKNEDN